MFPARSPQPALFKNARKKLRCSQAQLARRLRVHRSTISRFEKGTLCPDAHHIETIEQLTGMAAEALITNFYSCAGRLEKSAEQVAQQAPEYYEYLHVKLCHEKKLHHLRWQLKRKQLDLATVNRCFTIDQTVMGALDAQIECLERIAHALKDSQAFEDAQAILNDYQQSKKAKSRIALIWARRFSFELEDEIKVMAQEIALRERLLQEAQAKADAIEAEKNGKTNAHSGCLPSHSRRVASACATQHQSASRRGNTGDSHGTAHRKSRFTCLHHHDFWEEAHRKGRGLLLPVLIRPLVACRQGGGF